jgi:hypothetical protein
MFGRGSRHILLLLLVGSRHDKLCLASGALARFAYAAVWGRQWMSIGTTELDHSGLSFTRVSAGYGLFGRHLPTDSDKAAAFPRTLEAYGQM